jgi:hypothetical protein
MKKKLTEKLVLEMVEKAKDKFFTSDRPEFEKEKLKRINVIPYISQDDLGCNDWGQAFLVHTSTPISDYLEEAKSQMPFMKVHGRMSWFILQLCPSLQEEHHIEVYDTVAHELAHLLDFCFDGYYTRIKRHWHTKRWREMFKAMGGTGLTSGLVAELPKKGKKRAKN